MRTESKRSLNNLRKGVSVMEKSKACRVLFPADDSDKRGDNSDDDGIVDACEGIAERKMEQATKKWNFDFEKDEPLAGEYEWEKVEDDTAKLSSEELPAKRKRSVKWAVRATVTSGDRSQSESCKEANQALPGAKSEPLTPSSDDLSLSPDPDKTVLSEDVDLVSVRKVQKLEPPNKL